MSRSRSHWLRITCALACRCTARFRVFLLLLGSAGIAGFCAAGVGFIVGWLSESQYLAGVASSLGMFAVCVLITHLGDPYELRRSECQRTAQPAEPMGIAAPRVTAGSISRSASSAAMN